MNSTLCCQAQWRGWLLRRRLKRWRPLLDWGTMPPRESPGWQRWLQSMPQPKPHHLEAKGCWAWGQLHKGLGQDHLQLGQPQRYRLAWPLHRDAHLHIQDCGWVHHLARPFHVRDDDPRSEVRFQVQLLLEVYGGFCRWFSGSGWLLQGELDTTKTNVNFHPLELCTESVLRRRHVRSSGSQSQRAPSSSRILLPSRQTYWGDNA